MNPDMLILRLSNARVFRDLSQSELRMMVDFGEAFGFAKGDPVPGEAQLLVVLTGAIEVTRGQSQDGKPWTVRLGPGAVLNELTFLGAAELHEAAVCVRPTTVFALARTTFEKLVSLGNASAAKIGAALARSIAARVQERNAALLKLMKQHQALLDSMERLLTDKKVQEELFGKGSTDQHEFSTFKEEVLSKWDY